jgi:hypothetical protein
VLRTVLSPTSPLFREARYLIADDRRPLIAVGGAKWGERMGLGHLERLRRIRTLLAAQGRHGAATARLVCYGGAGFDDDLRRAAGSAGDVALVGLPDLYRAA